jgi:dsRNA-specific ribonuclease
MMLRDKTTESDTINSTTSIIIHKDLAHITQIGEWLKSHEINIEREESITYLQALLHVTFTKQAHLANNDRFQPLGKSLLQNAARSAITKAAYNDNKLSKRDVSELEEVMIDTNTLRHVCDQLSLTNLVLCEQEAIDLACASAIRGIVAAIYLQQGPNKCREFVDRHIMPQIFTKLESSVKSPTDHPSDDIIPLPEKLVTVAGVPDYPTLLQDMIRDQHKALVHYRAVKGEMVLARTFQLRRMSYKKKGKKVVPKEIPNAPLWVALYINNKVTSLT